MQLTGSQSREPANMATTAQHSVHRPSPASTLARTPPSSAAANDDQVSSSENVQQQMQNSHEVAVPINHHLSQGTLLFFSYDVTCQGYVLGWSRYR